MHLKIFLPLFCAILTQSCHGWQQANPKMAVQGGDENLETASQQTSIAPLTMVLDLNAFLKALKEAETTKEQTR